ncbi:hypothetical protein HHX48_12790 [Salinimonas sp. HHU 13199]|uniref:Outer membrane protein beta-barrel domain-containing protein n=1 Tax=Salinimonas profundi TaxID=2729140 RepID=A0ABR8LQD4_9ALTE|nr:outer membrane beta-barrel protein [Salinimonas profundi]MBD3586617.1 hypothetical protein [Salinimonas profundi]
MDKNKKRLMAHKFTASKLALFTCTALAAGSASAGDLQLKPTVSSDAIFQQIDSDRRGDRDITTLRIVPSLDAVYKAKRAEASVNASATHLERNNDVFDSKEDYLEYRYQGSLNVIERLLTIGAQGQSRYLNANTNNFLISDKLTNSGDLARTQTDSVSASTNLTRNPFIETTASVSYSKVQTEENQQVNTQRLNNDTFAATASLREGEGIKGFKWEFDGEYSDTDRSEVNLGTFESHEANGFLDRLLFNRWALRLTGMSESYSFISQGNFIQNDRDFNSVGAGITYYQADSRYIALTINKADSSNPDNDGDVYPGVDLKWSFTNRTSINASYGKRFYGDAANFNLRHATRKIRTSISYEEEVRTFSQFLSANNTDGVLVCPGAGFSPNCFQPDSLAYELTDGQQFIQLGEDNNALDDSIVLRKGATFEMSYQSRVFTVGIFARYNDDEYLGQNRRRKTESAGANISYRVGAFTRVNSSLSFADIERESDVFRTGTGENMVFNLGVNHTFSPHLNLNAGYTYTDQTGDVSLNAFGSDYKEHRFQIGATYTFR